MKNFWFIAGPPFAGTMWADVLDRMANNGLNARCWDMLEAGSGSLNAETKRLVADIEAADDDIVLVGHGAALPLLNAVNSQTDLAGLVFSNGPLGQYDLITKGLTTFAALPMAMIGFSSRLAVPFLASSAGLRRTVVNPYVMDHDMTVAICKPILGDRTQRARALCYLKSLPKHPVPPNTTPTPTLLCWGDADPLSAGTYASFKPAVSYHITKTPVEGGQYFYPIERPWAMADTISSWASKHQTTT